MAPDQTPNLGLIRAYWPDPANVMDNVANWNVLDAALADVINGHNHDSENSAPIDPTNLDWIVAWLRRHDAQILALQNEVINIWRYYEMFYDEFLRHNHTGAQTLWIESFENFQKTNTDLSTALVNPARNLLALPAGYQPGRSYFHLGEPFPLNPDEWPDPEKPTTVRGRIVMKRMGEVIPYVAVGDNLQASRERPHFYPGALQGERLLEGSQTVLLGRTRHDFAGKIRGRMQPNLSSAYHHLDVAANRPVPNDRNPRFPHGGEFSQAEYDTLSRRDATYIVTAQNAERGQTLFDRAEADVEHEAKPLYDAAQPLCWDRRANRFYWFDSTTLRFTPLSAEEAGGFHHDDLVQVAATVQPETGIVYALKTFTPRLGSPAGHFANQHQIVSYDPRTGVHRTGPVWTTLRAKAYFQPAVTIAPTRLEVEGGKLHILTELDALRSKADDVSYVNYYGSNATDSGNAALNYQWLPFGSLYPEALLNGEGYVNFAAFNPGVLATAHSIQLRGVEPSTWRPTGPAKVIEGEYPRTGPYAALPEAPASSQVPAPGEGAERSIEGFEGVNTKLYLGLVAGKMYFYQAFCPYNPSAVLDTEAHQSEEWLLRHGDVAWRGFIEYDLATGTSRSYTGGADAVPWLAGCGGSMGAGEIVLAEGLELAEQFVEMPEAASTATVPRLLAADADEVSAEDVRVSQRMKIVVNPAHPRATTRIQAQQRILITANRNTGGSTRVEASQSVRVGSSINLQQSVVITGGGSVTAIQNIAIVGGKQSPPATTRPRPVDPPQRKPAKAVPGITHRAQPRQMFMFRGLDVEPEDVLRVHVKARSSGADPRGDAEDLGAVGLYHVRIWGADSQWSALRAEEGRLRDEERVFSIRLDPGVFRTLGSPDAVNILIEAVAVNDAPRNVVARLELDYLYLTVESPAFAYDYEWSGMPQGSEAAVVLDCKNDARVPGGVEVKAIQLDVDSSR